MPEDLNPQIILFTQITRMKTRLWLKSDFRPVITKKDTKILEAIPKLEELYPQITQIMQIMQIMQIYEDVDQIEARRQTSKCR